MISLRLQEYEPPRAEPLRRRGGPLVWLERLLVSGGSLALLACAYVVVDAALAQRGARDELRSSMAQAAKDRLASQRTTPSTTGATAESSRGTDVDALASSTQAWPLGGAPAVKLPIATTRKPLGELSIPRVGLSAVVFEGSDARTLRVGLGHLEGTPLPGGEGNAAIAGHRDTFFYPLQYVQVGDDVWVEAPEGRFHYRVTWLRVVGADETSVIEPTDDAALTLVTCFPFWFTGSAPERFVVRANRATDATEVCPVANDDLMCLKNVR